MNSDANLRSSAAAFFVIAALLQMGVPRAMLAQNYTESVIYSFSAGSDGANPFSSLVQASDGNLYGTTYYGGPSGFGTVFRISNLATAPTESVIYSFTGGADGAGPEAALIQASDGNLYGTTFVGGLAGSGTVFEISNLATTPAETVIYSFDGESYGGLPEASLIQASDGNLYGTTFNGGVSNQGAVFKISNLSTTPTESVIYSFTGLSDGGLPDASLIQASDGNLYGTTRVGGSGNQGTVFKISNLATTPTESVIYSFTGGSDGSLPDASLIEVSDGNLYGTTRVGGSGSQGTVFKISNLATTPTESVIYSFTGGSDGANPYKSLIQAFDGNLYGTTPSGGSAAVGTVFKISNLATTPAESVIYSFAGGSDGSEPEASLIQASDGNLYGTTFSGGSGSAGVVFRIARTPARYYTIAPCRLIDTRSSSTAPYGGPALAGGSKTSYIAPIHCGIPSGAIALSANLTVVGPQANGDLRLFPTLQGSVPSSVINFDAGKTRANNVITALDLNGSMTIQCDMVAGNSTNVLFDVNGYFK